MERYADNNFFTDTLLSILANSRRRIVIRFVADHDPVEMKELADVIASIEDCSEKSAYTALNQTHIPKLKRVDVLNQENGINSVTKGEHYACAKLILDYCDQL